MIVPKDSGMTNDYDVGVMYGSLTAYPYAARIKSGTTITRLDTIVVSKYCAGTELYKIYVKKAWSTTPVAFKNTDAKIIITAGGYGATVQEISISESTGNDGDYWFVATMDNAGLISIKNSIVTDVP